jgi:DNA-binding response OmpR family regulator
MEVGLECVKLGDTTLVEVERVLGKAGEDEESDGRSGPARILVVDDEVDARLLIRTLLEQEGFEVDEAEDGKEALRILEEDPRYHLVILDLAMPGLDGREVLANIRGSVATAAIPVVIRTGTGDDTIEAELLEAGADDYLDKSVDKARVLARVNAVLRRTVL